MENVATLGQHVIEAHTLGLAGLGHEHDLASPVPTCGDWTLADLIWHLSEVQHFWAHIITNRPSGPESYEPPDRPDDGQLARFLSQRCALLVDALDSAAPDDEAWSWSDDHTVEFTLRRQSHEALVHHFDGVLAVGSRVPPVAPALAADGVDELVDVMLTGVPAWATFEAGEHTIQLVATDADRVWPLRFGRMTGTSPDSGQSYDLTALEKLAHLDAPSTVVSGSALALDLWMWGRGDDIAVSGDADGTAHMRAAVVEATQ